MRTFDYVMVPATRAAGMDWRVHYYQAHRLFAVTFFSLLLISQLVIRMNLGARAKLSPPHVHCRVIAKLTLRGRRAPVGWPSDRHCPVP